MSNPTKPEPAELDWLDEALRIYDIDSAVSKLLPRLRAKDTLKQAIQQHIAERERAAMLRQRAYDERELVQPIWQRVDAALTEVGKSQEPLRMVFRQGTYLQIRQALPELESLRKERG